MDTVNLDKHNPNYPSTLNKHMGEDAPKALTAIGNVDIRVLTAYFHIYMVLKITHIIVFNAETASKPFSTYLKSRHS